MRSQTILTWAPAPHNSTVCLGATRHHMGLCATSHMTVCLGATRHHGPLRRITYSDGMPWSYTSPHGPLRHIAHDGMPRGCTPLHRASAPLITTARLGRRVSLDVRRWATCHLEPCIMTARLGRRVSSDVCRWATCRLNNPLTNPVTAITTLVMTARLGRRVSSDVCRWA